MKKNRRKKLSKLEESRIISKTAKEIFLNSENLYERGDELEFTAKTPKKPQLPIMLLQVAILKDVLDSFTFTGVGWVITTATSFMIFIIFFIWLLGKTSGGWWKKRLFKKLWRKYILKRLILMGIVESIPILQIIPTCTIFLLMIYNKERKVVKLLNKFLEALHKAGVK